MKSDHGVPARIGGTKMQISSEEYDFRWDYGKGKLGISVAEFDKRIEEIRKRTGKPNCHMGKGRR